MPSQRPNPIALSRCFLPSSLLRSTGASPQNRDLRNGSSGLDHRRDVGAVGPRGTRVVEATAAVVVVLAAHGEGEQLVPGGRIRHRRVRQQPARGHDAALSQEARDLLHRRRDVGELAPDARKFPSSVLGKPNGWPGERWLDIRQLSVLEPLVTARFQMCKQKGFDAIEPDNMDGYQNHTGFDISAHDQLSYDRWVAKEAHSVGLAVFQKNDPEQATQLQPDFDGVLDEQCNEYSECSSFHVYLRAGKPVLNAEYSLPLSRFCPADNRAGIMGALYNLNLDGATYQACWRGSPGFGPSGGGRVPSQ